MSTEQHPPKLVRTRTIVRAAVTVLLSFLMAATLAVLPANAASAHVIAQQQAIARLLSGSALGTAANGTTQPSASQAGQKPITAASTPVLNAATVGAVAAAPSSTHSAPAV